MRNVINHTQAKGQSKLQEVAMESVHAKNALVREHGWSPVALVSDVNHVFLESWLTKGIP